MVSGCSEKRKKKKVSLIIDYSSQYTFPRHEKKVARDSPGGALYACALDWPRLGALHDGSCSFDLSIYVDGDQRVIVYPFFLNSCYLNFKITTIVAQRCFHTEMCDFDPQLRVTELPHGPFPPSLFGQIIRSS